MIANSKYPHPKLQSKIKDLESKLIPDLSADIGRNSKEMSGGEMNLVALIEKVTWQEKYIQQLEEEKKMMQCQSFVAAEDLSKQLETAQRELLEWKTKCGQMEKRLETLQRSSDHQIAALKTELEHEKKKRSELQDYFNQMEDAQANLNCETSGTCLFQVCSNHSSCFVWKIT